jgi:hypothetical protein
LFKGLSHANLKGSPRLRFSVNGFEIRINLSDFQKFTRIKKGNPSIILAKISDLSNEETEH